MKHRITAILAALSICACSMPMAVYAEKSSNTSGTYGDIKWNITDDVLTLEGSGEVIYEHGFPDEDTDMFPNWGHEDTITKIVFGEGVTGADSYAFSDYTALETVVLSEGFDTFSAYLFKDCPNLREIQGIEYVEYFNTHCLSGTAMMEEDPFLIVDGELRYCDISEAMDIVVPEGVTRIGRDAFGNLMNLPYYEDEGEGMMYDIEEVKFTITLPETVESLEEYAFSNLTSLTGVNIPDSVTEVGDMAFLNCLCLQSLSLSENVKKIGDYAFFNCKAMEELTVSGMDTQLGKDAFGVAIDIEQYLKDNYSEEQYERLKDDLFRMDILLCTRLPWLFEEDYIEVDRTVLTENVKTYGYVPETQAIRGYADSTANSYADEKKIRFVPIEKEALPLGDVDGDTLINAVDASIILTEAANISTGGDSKLTAEQRSRSDVNADGAYNAMDAALILQYAAYAAAGGTDTFEEFLK